MPAAKVTYEEVAAAIEHFRRNNIPDPGVHRLIAHIGHGSATTVARHKHAWREVQLAQVSREASSSNPLPDPIAQRTSELWAELLEAVDAIDTDRQNEAAATIAEARTAEHARTLERDRLQEDLTQAHHRIGELEATIETQREGNRSLESDLTLAEHQAQAMATTNAQLQERIDDLKVSQTIVAQEHEAHLQSLRNAHARDAIKHREERDSLQSEISQLQVAIDRWRNDIQALDAFQRKNQADAQAREEKLQTRLNQATHKLEREVETSATLRTQWEEFKLQLASRDAEIDSLKQARDTSRERLEAMSEALLTRDSEIALLRLPRS